MLLVRINKKETIILVMSILNLTFFFFNFQEFGGNVSSKAITDFIDAGGNVLIAASTQLSI